MKNIKTQTADEIIDKHCMTFGNTVSRSSLKEMIAEATKQAIYYGYKAGFYAENSSHRRIDETVNEYLNEIYK